MGPTQIKISAKRLILTCAVLFWSILWGLLY